MATRELKPSFGGEKEKLPDQIPAPDPLWPTGAVPEHLLPAQRAEALVKSQYEGVDTWTCKKCGTHLNKSSGNPELCGACYALEASATALQRRSNANWTEIAQECGLALHERQPEETDIEWLIWDRYRSHYPLKLPTWSELAKECGCSVATVMKAAQKWSFRVRMQAWARYTDDGMSEERIAAVKEMNARQTEMAVTLQAKLKEAIDKLDPALLRPGEIVNLLKASTELERRIKEALPQRVEGTVADTSAKQKQLTKAEDIGEVVEILSKTGMLPGQKLAVEQTTTTRIIAAAEPLPQVPDSIVDTEVIDVDDV